MASQWYFSKNGKQKLGPVTTAQLQGLAQSGQLSPNDMIWKEGMAQWTPASKLKGLFADQAVVAQAPPLPPPEYLPPIPSRALRERSDREEDARPRRRRTRSRYDDDEEYDDEDYSPRRRSRHEESGAGKVCSILSVIFGGVAFILCPPIFGLAGLVLGIIGTSLSKEKALGVLGICLSVVGTLVGMIIGAALMGTLQR